MESLNLDPADLGLLVTSVRACAPSGHISFRRAWSLGASGCGQPDLLIMQSFCGIIILVYLLYNSRLKSW